MGSIGIMEKKMETTIGFRALTGSMDVLNPKELQKGRRILFSSKRFGPDQSAASMHALEAFNRHIVEA